MTLPSARQIGDVVMLNMWSSERVPGYTGAVEQRPPQAGRVVAVTFTASKVLYDVELLDEYEAGLLYERVDSAFVHEAPSAPVPDPFWVATDLGQNGWRL